MATEKRGRNSCTSAGKIQKCLLISPVCQAKNRPFKRYNCVTDDDGKRSFITWHISSYWVSCGAVFIVTPEHTPYVSYQPEIFVKSTTSIVQNSYKICSALLCIHIFASNSGNFSFTTPLTILFRVVCAPNMRLPNVFFVDNLCCWCETLPFIISAIVARCFEEKKQFFGWFLAIFTYVFGLFLSFIWLSSSLLSPTHKSLCICVRATIEAMYFWCVVK